MPKTETKLKIVIDTSVYIRYLLGGKGSATETLFSKWEQGQFKVLISYHIVDELIRALNYPQVKKIIESDNETEEAVKDLLMMIENPLLTEEVAGNYQINIVKTDFKDNIILACAIEGKANYIVTVDEKDLLSMKQIPPPYQKIKIFSPAQFLQVLGNL